MDMSDMFHTQKTRVIARGDHATKINRSLGHRALLRCRRSLNNLRPRKSAVATSPAARCATPKGSARGLLDHPVGHYLRMNGRFSFFTATGGFVRSIAAPASIHAAALPERAEAV